MTDKAYYTTTLDTFFETCMTNSEMYFTLHGHDYQLIMDGASSQPNAEHRWSLWDATTKKDASPEYPSMFELAAAHVWDGKTLLQAWPEMKLYE